MTTKRDFSTAPIPTLQPAIGYEVFTVDGMRVGTVSRISGAFMRIDAVLRPDFWLRLDDATNVEAQAITLAYPREALDQHKHSEPAASPDDLMPTGTEPVLLDEAEQLAQRELMERELEEQRRRLAEHREAEVEQREARRPSMKQCARCIAAIAAIAVGLAAVRMWRRRRPHEPAEPASLTD